MGERTTQEQALTTQTGKEEDYEDLPTRTPMRPAGLRNSPSTDQKKVRRRLVQGVAEPTRTTMTTEADLLRAMTSAHPDEQAHIMARVDALRQERRAALEAEQSALWHQMAYQPAKTASVAHTAQSDWLNGVAPSDRYDGSVARTAARVWHARISDGVKADRGEYLEQAKGVAFRQASAHGEHARDFAMTFMAEAETLVPGSSRMDTIRQILESSQSQTVDGMLVDTQTANVLVQVFDALSPENQAKVDQVPLDRLVEWAWSKVGSKTAEADPSERASDNFPDPTVHPPEDDTDYANPPEPSKTFDDADDLVWDSIPEAHSAAWKSEEGASKAVQRMASLTKSARALHEIAAEISADWKNVNYGAVPYLEAMYELESITDMYYQDPAKSIVAYFLSNATSWRGETAKRVKAELKAMLTGKGAAKTAISLTNVGFEGGIGSNTAHGYDSAGNKVIFRLTDKEAKDLAFVMTSDLWINFSGVDVDEADIIREGSKTAGESRRCQWCNKSISFSGGQWQDTQSGTDCGQSNVGHSPSPRQDVVAPPKDASKTAAQWQKMEGHDGYNDQQADLTGGFYAEVGPDSGGRWSWTIISPEGDEVDGGVEDDEGSAKSMAEGWRATASAPPRNASKTAGTATCPSCGASNHGNAERCAHCGAIMGNSKDWTKKESAGYAPVPGEPFRWLGDPQWSQNTKSFRELFPDGVPMRDEDLTPEQKAFLDAKRPMASLSPQQAAFRNRVQASLASGSRRPFSDGKTAMPNPVDLGVKVGDIFYSSWGYDQTNVNFYEVTGLTGASVKVREVAQRVERSTPPQDYVVPVPGQYIGGEMTKRISGGIEGGYNRPSIRIDYSQTAWLWDGTPKYQTSTGWGH